MSRAWWAQTCTVNLLISHMAKRSWRQVPLPLQGRPMCHTPPAIRVKLVSGPDVYVGFDTQPLHGLPSNVSGTFTNQSETQSIPLNVDAPRNPHSSVYLGSAPQQWVKPLCNSPHSVPSIRHTRGCPPCCPYCDRLSRPSSEGNLLSGLACRSWPVGDWNSVPPGQTSHAITAKLGHKSDGGSHPDQNVGGGRGGEVAKGPGKAGPPGEVRRLGGRGREGG